MSVDNSESFKLIYSIVDEGYIGVVIEPHVVQINANGLMTLTHQRLYKQTAHSFKAALTENDFKAIALLDEITPDALFKKFREIALVPKKVVKPAEFFKKYYSEEAHTKYIRPFIEKKLLQAFQFIDKGLLYASANDNPAHKPLLYEPDAATVLFHFRRNEEGTRYFATIKHGDRRVEYMKPETRIIISNPALLMAEDKIYCFEEGVEAKRFSPFLKQKWITVKPQSEEKYFKTFVVPLLERFDVYAEGFEIVTEKVNATPMLSIQLWGDKYYMAVGFQYGSQYFNYNNAKRIHVSLEQVNNEFIFHKIKRSAAWERSKVDMIKQLDLQLYEGSLYQVKNAGLYESIEWLGSHEQQLREAGFKIGQQLSKKYFIGSQHINIDFKTNSDWFDVKILVQFGDFNIPFIELKKYITSNTREFILPNGDVGVIPAEWFSKYYALFENSEDGAEHLKLKKYHVGILQALWQDGDHRHKTWEEKLKNFVEPTTQNLPANFHAELRKYQREGFEWMCFLKSNGFGGILADDMGLGKTIQTLCLLQNEKELQATSSSNTARSHKNIEANKQFDLFTQNDDAEVLVENETIRKPSLLIVPTSLSYNWQNEAKKFAPDLQIMIHAGTNRKRDISHFTQYDLIITTYGILRSDANLFKEMEFNYIILDESQAVKNPMSVTAKTLQKLRAVNRLALTGTPIENSVTDLWSQLNFVNPGLLGSFNHFQDEYAIPIEKEQDFEKANKLQQIIKPFLLRRTKEMVAQDLPEKTESTMYCEMEEDQKSYYEEIKSYYRNEILQSIENETYVKNKLSVLQGLTKLRLIANHPILNDETYTGSSTKFQQVTHMTHNALEHGHKIIIFSQFVKHLAIYKKHFTDTGIDFEYLDGSSSASERKASVERFQSDASLKVFLISLKAGGFGLNLTAADYVFLLDPWWNPAIERQAQDRSHRIGQDKKVFIYKFITKDTIEEKILALQNKKNRLAESIITAQESLLKKINAKELLDLLL